MNVGDYVRYTAAWLRSGSCPRHEVLKHARAIGRIEAANHGTSFTAVEVSWPGTRRRNQLINPEVLEVVQEGGRR